MLRTVFRSDELPPGERLARFNDLQVNSVHPMRVVSARRADFHATARTLDLESVNVVDLKCAPSDVQRTPRLVRAYDPELYSVVFPLRGRLAVMQRGREASLSRYDFALYDSRHPVELRIAGENAALVRVHLPHALLPLPVHQIDRILAVSLPGRTGVGALLTGFLTRLITDSSSYRATDLPRLSRLSADLLNTAIAHHLDAGKTLPDDSRQQALLLRVQTFVHRHLHDSSLSPQSVAAAHHISVSYLHRLFRPSGISVSAWIRQERLDRARRDLCDPALGGVPVHRARLVGDSMITPASRGPSARPTASLRGTAATARWEGPTSHRPLRARFCSVMRIC